MTSPWMSGSFPSGNCSQVRARLYQILEGQVAPDELAMNVGSQLEWTRVIVQRCPISPQVHLNLSRFVFTFTLKSNISSCILPLSHLFSLINTS